DAGASLGVDVDVREVIWIRERDEPDVHLGDCVDPRYAGVLEEGRVVLRRVASAGRGVFNDGLEAAEDLRICRAHVARRGGEVHPRAADGILRRRGEREVTDV